MIEVTVNGKQAGEALVGLAKLIRDPTIPNRQLATQLYGWVIRNYDSRGALQIKPWAPLSPRTAKEKIRLGYSPEPLAPRTGNLRTSFNPFSDASQAGVGARASFGVDYAEVHEYGAPARNIPARPMLPPEDIGIGYATRVYERFVVQSQRRVGL